MYRAVTALSMRLFSSSDKHSLQKIHSQHLVQINLVVDSVCCLFNFEVDQFASESSFLYFCHMLFKCRLSYDL
jgi:hypothetical protein